MPIVQIQITPAGLTPDRKAELVKGATRLMTDVLGKDPAHTVVVIQPLEHENWGLGGLPIPPTR